MQDSLAKEEEAKRVLEEEAEQARQDRETLVYLNDALVLNIIRLNIIRLLESILNKQFRI